MLTYPRVTVVKKKENQRRANAVSGKARHPMPAARVRDVLLRKAIARATAPPPAGMLGALQDFDNAAGVARSAT